MQGSSSGATHSNPADHSGGSPNPVQPAGFSLGRGSPLIPPKLVTKILKREYVSVGEQLPDNLKLARISAEAQRSASYSSKAPKKRELTEDWERTGGLVCLFLDIYGHSPQAIQKSSKDFWLTMLQSSSKHYVLDA